MHWSDQAVILSVHKFSEHSAVVKVFSEERGIFAGTVRGAFSRKNRATYEAGNMVSADWSARLPEHLGTLRCELLQPIPAFFMGELGKLLALQSAAVLIHKCLAERDPHPILYRAFWGLLQEMKFGGPWLESYVKLELTLLQEAGFRLELEHCAVGSHPDNLAYVSPRSGKAVCYKAGEPYKERLLPLPEFLQNDNSMIRLFNHSQNSQYESSENRSIEPSQILDGLRLTGYFLASRIWEPHTLQAPDSRQRLIRWMEKQQTTPAEVKDIEYS